MARESGNRKSKLLRRYVLSLIAFMLVLIVVLSAAAASIIRFTLMKYSNVYAFNVAGALAEDCYVPLSVYDDVGTIDEKNFDDLMNDIYNLSWQWDLTNCYVAVPEEDGLRYLFGAGERILSIHMDNPDLDDIMEYVAPYPKGFQAWTQSVIEAQDNQSKHILEFWDPDNGHMAYAAAPIYGFDANLIAVAYVEVSLNHVYNMIVGTTAIMSGLIALITTVILIVFYRRTRRRVVLPIHALNSEALMIKNRLNAGEVYRSDIHTGDEIEELSQSIEQMSCELRDYIAENTRITAERERFGAELDTAARIQASQLPNVFPAFPDRKDFDLYATMKPAKEVGGDFYDFFLIDDDHIALVMADVSGKGVPAALFMMISKALIKNHLKAGLSPAEALQTVNTQLLETNRTRQFVTVWLAVVELSTGRGVAANAGHEHPALRRAGGGYELVVYKHSPPVAATELSRFYNREFELKPGDSLFVYTDGVAEAIDASGVLFGTDRMLAALNGAPDADPEATIANVRDAMRAFVGEADQFDDITMLCLRYNGPAEQNKRTE